MATRVKKATKPDPYLYPEVDPECLSVLRELYARYTGYQIAQCIAQIRREITAAEEQAAIKEQIAQLTEKLSK